MFTVKKAKKNLKLPKSLAYTCLLFIGGGKERTRRQTWQNNRRAQDEVAPQNFFPRFLLQFWLQSYNQCQSEMDSKAS